MAGIAETHMNQTSAQQIAAELFEQKRSRRKEVAALPVERKFEILLQLQRLAYDVAKSTGRPAREPWKVATQ
jgi:hypothetical protein